MGSHPLPVRINAVAKADPKRILMVDDDVALLRIMREALTACLRCEVDTSPKPEYGERARRFIENDYSLQTAVRRVEATYRELVPC